MDRWILSGIYPTVHNTNGMVPFAFWGGTESVPIYIYVFYSTSSAMLIIYCLNLTKLVI